MTEKILHVSVDDKLENNIQVDKIKNVDQFLKKKLLKHSTDTWHVMLTGHINNDQMDLIMLPNTRFAKMPSSDQKYFGLQYGVRWGRGGGGVGAQGLLCQLEKVLISALANLPTH